VLRRDDKRGEDEGSAWAESQVCEVYDLAQPGGVWKEGSR
jgi:hypothetical protein